MKTDLKKYTVKSNHAYSLGAILAINAVSDAFMLLDAPDCAIWRIDQVHGSHDMLSTLWDPAGFHRVFITETSVKTIVMPRQEQLADSFRSMRERPECGAVFALGYPFVTITETRYKGIWESVRGGRDVPFFEIDGGKFEYDWLDGYSAVLETIAKNIVFSKKKKKKNSVAVIGYMMDRNEPDHIANLAEMERMLSGIGLNLVSVWLNGRTLDSLADAGGAELIISLPHGRPAAKIVAERLGADVIELEVPFCLEGTSEWLLEIAGRAGQVDKAKTFIDKELAAAAARVEWFIPKYFTGRTFIYFGDPAFAAPLRRQLQDLGSSLIAVIATASEQRVSDMGIRDKLDIPVYSADDRAQISDICAGRQEVLMLGSGVNNNTVTIGFPSYGYHPMHDAPFIGYKGALCFLDRVASHIQNSSRNR